MPGIYHEAECIAKSGHKLLFFVSCGRDTSCFLEVMSRHTDMGSHSYVHYTPYETMLPYQARHIAYLESKYGVKVSVRPDPRSQAHGLRGVAEDRDILLKEFGCGLAVLGYRMDESLQRRGMLKRLADGIDPKTRECYPLRSWTSRITDTFVKTARVRLSPEYSYGYRDCRTHRGIKAVLLRMISEEDFQAACKMDPNIEVDYVRYEKINRDALNNGSAEIPDDDGQPG